MAFTYGTPVSTSDFGGITSITVPSLTVASGASAVFCGVGARDPVSSQFSPVTADWDPTGVNEALTSQVEHSYGSPGQENVALLGRLSPTAKTADLRINFNGNVTQATAFGLGISGGSTSSLSEATGTQDGGAASQNDPTVPITPTTTTSVVIGQCSHRDNIAPVPDNTDIYSITANGDSGGAQRHEPGSVSLLNLGWDDAGNYTGSLWAACAIAYPLAAAAAITPGALMMGM